MSQTMFSIQSGEREAPKAVANLLPCRIHHEGPVGSTDSFWKPTTTPPKSSGSSSSPTAPEGDNQTAYFRGRKLQGRTVRLPEGYRGVVVEKQPEEQPAEREAWHHFEEMDGDEQKEEAEKEKQGVMRITAEFDRVVVWGHESTANAETDPHVRGIEEWVQVAERIHSY
ncbi:ribonuclease H1 small subunit [Sodiomyces alkalinus F11]|uniref:Ribonuclease H1 small subunit n=1 Tax=Sodiomyces alkalinus (strain CBS 110278 / VKM F-3762 / F11) TaxID=1314773 RepID=A0A3N2Q5C9_SODAK|nr:ribonuclease H1 small subunit [Sodiomyces alkalinus F11]ROT41858.1 ribonuclease H1 small subunit [Sodiomyces alkalinus F11]